MKISLIKSIMMCSVLLGGLAFGAQGPSEKAVTLLIENNSKNLVWLYNRTGSYSAVLEIEKGASQRGAGFIKGRQGVILFPGDQNNSAYYIDYTDDGDIWLSRKNAVKYEKLKGIPFSDKIPVIINADGTITIKKLK